MVELKLELRLANPEKNEKPTEAETAKLLNPLISAYKSLIETKTDWRLVSSQTSTRGIKSTGVLVDAAHDYQGDTVLELGYDAEDNTLQVNTELKEFKKLPWPVMIKSLTETYNLDDETLEHLTIICEDDEISLENLKGELN